MTLESCDSFEYVLDTAFVFMLCGGKGLFEKMDIVAEGGTLVELESLYQRPVFSDADVKADSLVNLACFARGAPAGRVCDGTVRFGLLGLSASVGVVTRSDDVSSGVRVARSFGSLPETLASIDETVKCP